MRRKICIKFLGEWLVASGLGDGSRADTVLVRDHHGLPFIPGKSIKGILREAARELGEARNDLKETKKRLFGGKDEDDSPGDLGILRISRGELEPLLRNELINIDNADRATFVNDLTIIRSQTAIDSTGSAKNKSLRRIECGIAGMEFVSTLDIDLEESDDEKWFDEYLRAVCAMVRVMGAGRYRGFGRCCITYNGQEMEEITVPNKEAAV